MAKKDNLFIKDMVKASKNEYASIVDDGIVGGDIPGHIDTGSYILNAQLSGSIYLGMPSNKRLALAGEESVGKTFYTLGLVSNALRDNPRTQVVYFESETALTKDMLVSRNIDVKRIAIFPVATIEQFRTEALNIVDSYLELPEDERPPLIMALDSLGNLSTNKEIGDTKTASDKRDMTKAPLIKGAFRMLTLRMGLANIPLIVTNHTYKEIGTYVPTSTMSGGSGLKYAADQTLFLSKKVAKEGPKGDETRVGSIITSVMRKSRFTVEGTKVQTLLRFDTGLDRYYGLLDFGQEAGVIEKVVAGRSFEYKFPDGNAYTEKQIHENPEVVYVKQNLDALDEAAKKEFLLGQTRATITGEKLPETE
jgi:RecA/RadA recombinase